MESNARTDVSRASGVRTGRAALVVAGVLLVAHPAVRPWADAVPASANLAYASPFWVPAHLAGVLGFVLVAIGLLGLRDLLATGGGARVAGLAVLVFWLGSAMAGTYYGAEAFALHAVGSRALDGADPDAVALVEAIRTGPVQLTLFGVGLASMAAAAVLAVVAARRSGVVPWVAGVPLAVAFVLYLPQFFGQPWLRIAHGALTAVGCLVLAATLRPSAIGPAQPNSAVSVP